ncbi:competence/damage-inducible protein A [Alkalibaculum bacchi]|uniref:competence/damage-inducible protein A n=1 Tax=Alkalibaculum bacchi TaxID=645887 RepID=UPI0026ECE197|nr:competence/damage-inducible protein A [Alkalibaculum bacchi]
MIGELINVGTEILIGDIVNTNAQYISKELSNIGFSIYYHTTVGDNPNRLKETLQNSLNRSDVVILTGGLGPTQDDLTKEILAEILGVELVLDQKIYDGITERIYKSGYSQVTQNNYKQAYIPKGASPIPNLNGTAPGILAEMDNKSIILLPGPPREMIPMFEQSVLPYLMKKTDTKFYSNYYKVTSIGESAVEDRLLDLIDKQKNPTIATYAKPGEVLIRVTANGKSREEVESLLQDYDVVIRERFEQNIYAFEDISLQEAVGKSLVEKNLTISIAESCTAGQIASRLSEFPGISQSFHSGIVCYSNEAKVRFVGVQQKTLDEYGAVSEETAREMLQGLYEKNKTDIVVATTGIAGPDGGSEDKPVGTVYIGILYKGQYTVTRHQFRGDRKRIQLWASNEALNKIRKAIEEK